MPHLVAAALLSALAGVGPGPSPLHDEELDRLRGGYVVAGGLTLDFGAVTRTLVDGRLALQTEVTWTAQGAQVVRTGGEAAPVALPAGGAGEVAFTTADGLSSVIQRVGPDGLANVVLNTASGRDIRQSTDVTLTLPGFQAVQGRLSDAMAAGRVAQAVADVALSAAVRR